MRYTKRSLRALRRWAADRAAGWYTYQLWFVGANFIPSTAINQLEMWQAETFDPDALDRELGWAAAAGMNAMRVFLHDLAWEDDAEGFRRRVESYLEISWSKGIRTIFALFDDCWSPAPRPGRQPEPVSGRNNTGRFSSAPADIADQVAGCLGPVRHI